MQQLFGVEPLRNVVEDRRLVPVPVEFKQAPPHSATFLNVPLDVVDGSQQKRKRGRPRKNENSVTVFVEEPWKVNLNRSSGNGEGNSGVVIGNEKGPEGNAVIIDNQKGFDGNTAALGNGKGFEGNAVAMSDNKGFEANIVATVKAPVVDAVGLDEDPFGDELKRRTQGLETETQVLEFLETLNGEWASRRKKRRIVPASDVGNLLPMGWKIVITLMRRAGRASAVCRRYVSPGGHQFESYREVSAYLLSVSGVQDRSELKSSYTDGAQQLSSSVNMASESSVGHVPTGDKKAYANACYFSLAGASIHSSQENQAPISSLVGSENFHSDLALGCKLGDTAGGAFRDVDHQTEDKQLLEADKNDENSVQGCSHVEDRVCNVHSEKLVGAIEASDTACNLYIPLVFSTSFSNNNSDTGQFSDEINAATNIKGGGISNVDSQDRNTGCYETVPCENEQVHVDNNGLGLSVNLVEDDIQKMSLESSMLAPNSEGKIFADENLEDRHVSSSLEDMEIRDEKAIKDDKQQIICSRDQAEIKDVSANVKLQSSSEGCSLVSSQNELEHTSISHIDKTQTSMLKDSAEENIFDSDLFSSSIDERTCIHSGYVSNVSFSSCTQDASEYGGFDFASDLKLTKDVSDSHILSNEGDVTRCLQERSTLNDQNSMMDISSQSNLLAQTGNQHPSDFHDNVNNISDGTFDALKAVDAGCMEPQLGIVSCSNLAVDAYTTASIMQGKSHGCVSVPLGGSILNFEKQSDDGVHKANKSCLPDKAQNFQTDSMGLPKFQ